MLELDESDTPAGRQEPESNLNRTLEPAKIGRQLRVWRAESGFTQADVAELIGVSPQQYQKYETGITRIELSRLFSICNALKKSPSALLENSIDTSVSDSTMAPQPDQPPFNDNDQLAQKLDLSFAVSEVVQLFMKINDPADQEAVMFMMRCYANKAQS